MRGTHDAVWSPADAAPLDPAAFWTQCAAAGDEAALVPLGKQLSRFVLEGSAGDAWEAARTAWWGNATNEQGAWRTGLRILDDALAALPWELMWRDGLPGWTVVDELFVREHTPRIAGPSLPIAEGWPWRILILVGAGPGDPAVKVEAEISAIHRAWWSLRHQMAIRWGTPSTLSELETLVEEVRPHILHFIGHGRPGGLQFGPKLWREPDIRAFFKNRCPVPWLVWLNACQSATAPSFDSAALGHRSLQRVFLELGTPLVAGMSGDIDGGLAVSQAKTFYEGLAQGASPHAALAEARRKAIGLRDEINPGGTTLHQPYLVSLVETTRAFAPLPIVPETQAFKQVISNTLPFQEVRRWFVDRHGTRLNLFADTLDTAGNFKRGAASRLVVLHGPARTGKTWLLHGTLQALASRGWLVRCHDMSGADALNWMKVLKLVRHGQPAELRDKDKDNSKSELLAALPDGAFVEFDQEFLARNALENSPGSAMEEDIGKLFQTFIAGLAKCAAIGGCPGVVVALDHLRRNSLGDRPAWLNCWEMNFLKPLGDGQPVPVIALVGVEDGMLKNSPLHQPGWTRELEPIPPNEVSISLKEYFQECLRKWCCCDGGQVVPDETVNRERCALVDSGIRLVAEGAAAGISPAELPEIYTEWAKYIRRGKHKDVPMIPAL